MNQMLKWSHATNITNMGQITVYDKNFAGEKFRQRLYWDKKFAEFNFANSPRPRQEVVGGFH